ncbi:hypothetical protein AcW1_005409 [Taiwanofungus camphoratus]|nr:hypothetical protein AcW1_005409 [Antrodia cinnamomea]
MSKNETCPVDANVGRDAYHSAPPLPPNSVYTNCYCEENIYLLAQVFSTRAEKDKNWPWLVYAVFISNDDQTVALWNQKAARKDVVVWDYHVVLVLLPRAQTEPNDLGPNGSEARAENETWVYDFDTRLSVPCNWLEYVYGTFPYAFDAMFADRVKQAYHSLFRVVPADIYLDHFASDRSHMLINPANVEDQVGLDGYQSPSSTPHAPDPQPFYRSAPPRYPPLCGRRARELGVTHNLMDSFVAMTAASVSSCRRTDAGKVDAQQGYGEVMDITGFVHWLSDGRE